MTDAQLKPCQFCESGNVKSGGDAPTDALAEHDAKVRADALQEAATICAECEETFERREANGAAHGAAMCFKAIRALIEGEA